MSDISVEARIVRPYKSNKEYLENSIDLFLKKYNDLALMEDKNKSNIKLEALMRDENFKLMHMFYNSYFDADNRNLLTKVNLSDCFDVQEFDTLEKMVVDNLKCKTYEGLIAPNGDYYPVIKSHYCLCSWLNLQGVDIRGYIRATMNSNGRLGFSDLTNYTDMDSDVHFNLTEQQIKAMYTLVKLSTNNKCEGYFHDIVEESHRYGFCKFSDTKKTIKQIGLFEDVLGKKIINSDEILLSKTKYYY